MGDASTMPKRGAALAGRIRGLAPGVLICGLIALAAQFLSDHYGAPAMLMALLIGMALNFVLDPPSRAAAGVGFSAKTLLRLGVALLGARIGLEAFAELGWPVLALVGGALIATLAFGYLAARVLGRGWRLAVLSAGSVAICGASAAMAIAAVLPRNEFSERNLAFTVFGVTLLSTVAMIVYPLVAAMVGLDELQTGIFLGATIHDVAQVVGAGFAVSDFTGETATTVKLIRVSMLAPFVLVLTLILRATVEPGDPNAARPPLVPGFVVAFAALVVLGSLGLVPPILREAATALSKWAMLTAIAAVGVKTELRKFREIPVQSVVLISAETLFIACFALVALRFLG
ncbi:YeiH family protein [Litorisediminicola beolgyonensis]|uniref:YeiH family protein n=1 Tax=Litorisediminicola beolgyonensis TaxID=1173614 RepID=A0ABW3ZJT5_9RHOB